MIRKYSIASVFSPQGASRLEPRGQPALWRHGEAVWSLESPEPVSFKALGALQGNFQSTPEKPRRRRAAGRTPMAASSSSIALRACSAAANCSPRIATMRCCSANGAMSWLGEPPRRPATLAPLLTFGYRGKPQAPGHPLAGLQTLLSFSQWLYFRD